MGRKILMHYKKHESLNDYACYYCGIHAESRDHIPAISTARFHPEYDRIVVRSCLLCNSLLGARFLPTLYHRAEYLLGKFRIRFRKYLSMPKWSDDEIDELTGRLKRTIIVGMKRKKDAEDRIKKIEELLHALTPDEIT